MNIHFINVCNSGNLVYSLFRSMAISLSFFHFTVVKVNHMQFKPNHFEIIFNCRRYQKLHMCVQNNDLLNKH